ncbi:MAG TPA: hypothetical protein VF381_14000 [Thermoanaerobaculia bacterium]
MNEMPLNERDFAEIRSNVLREIARRQRRNTIFAVASVAFAAIAIVFVLIPRRIETHGGEHAAEVGGATQKPAAPPRVAPPTSAATVVASQPIQHHRKPHHRKPTHEPIAIASAEQQPITIELHTANPDIRIIWIAK